MGKKRQATPLEVQNADITIGEKSIADTVTEKKIQGDNEFLPGLSSHKQLVIDASKKQRIDLAELATALANIYPNCPYLKIIVDPNAEFINGKNLVTVNNKTNMAKDFFIDQKVTRLKTEQSFFDPQKKGALNTLKKMLTNKKKSLSKKQGMSSKNKSNNSAQNALGDSTKRKQNNGKLTNTDNYKSFSI